MNDCAKVRSHLGAVLLVLAFSGCDEFKQADNTKKPPATKVVRESRIPVHRFVQTRNYDVAFDTQTGQVCRTWDWTPSGKGKTDANGVQLPRVYGEFTPTCLSLYESYPSGVNTPTETIPDEQPSN